MVAQKEGPHHRALLDARQARHQGTLQVTQLGSGHPGPDEVSGDGFGQHNITVTAIIPGVVDAPLIRYEKRLLESIGEIAGRRWKT
jgi:hypothetical protein